MWPFLFFLKVYIYIYIYRHRYTHIYIAVENPKLAFKIKEIIGIVENWRAGLGLHPQCWWSKESTINNRKMVSEEIHHHEEVRHIATAVKQGNRLHGPSGSVQKTELSHGAISSTWSLKT